MPKKILGYRKFRNKYRKFKCPKASYIFKNTLVFSIACDKWGSNNSTIFKNEESIEILKTFGLTDSINE